MDRLPVHGTVQTERGEKFDAAIMFSPVDGKRPVANGMVKNGEYHFTRGNGPTVGPAKVVVRRIVRRGGAASPSQSADAGPPAKTEWIMESNVVDDGKYILDFTLKD